MIRIRTLRSDDLPQVVSLYRKHLAWPHIATHDELVTSFARIFLSAPLLDPSVPSLVCESADGKVVGFLGSPCNNCDQPPTHRGIWRFEVPGPEEILLCARYAAVLAGRKRLTKVEPLGG